MKRTQAVALLAGAAIGLGGVAAGFVLARKEGREAAQRTIRRTGVLAGKVRERSAQAVGTARVQYESVAPRAAEALNSVMATMPRAAELVAARVRGGQAGDGTMASEPAQ